jgi:hypothetical protein
MLGDAHWAQTVQYYDWSLSSFLPRHGHLAVEVGDGRSNLKTWLHRAFLSFKIVNTDKQTLKTRERSFRTRTVK